MKRANIYCLDHFNRNVIPWIAEKYNLQPMEAVRAFLTSETHAMLEDDALAMWEFSAPAVFDMWESERVTGDPRNSVFLRSEAE